MQALALIVRFISRLNILLGHFFSWFSLGIVLVCFTVVVLRYVFSMGHVWMQDLYVWLNAMMFMGIAGFALYNNSHVRVDIFYRPASRRRKAMVDMFGSVFFVGPFVWVLFSYGLPYVQRSWRFMEGSANFGGMPGLYVIKTFILVFAVVIALQALAMFLRGLLVLLDREDLLPEMHRYQEDK
ncbi:TRAP transporter small permease subunit [Marinospirillum alkaliphilum]|uniref:TRAP transporter small permease protein n=1 Tax=Marinospirillum alkaliphilum DSM 21637 TaxID=1122209 RepID=A0A1K1WNB9_9GAMM|nr:TRAP transporter small permease subunit [Marinospirillum alkaliphilum]SFX38890.1 TRAP-type mannitol/chloroaromatic compound transport system, small permease component [Marinospirillum alkaliphilum DSM 21637]